MIPRSSLRHGGRLPGRVHALDAGYRVVTAAGAILLLVGLGYGSVGCAVAQVPGPPEAAAAAAASPPPTTGHTRIIRYPDGRAVITRDSYGTDITVQRTPGGPGTQGGWNGPEGDHGRPQPGSSAQHEHQPAPSLRDEYRRRMLDRLDRHP